jgi:hypothetical protein
MDSLRVVPNTNYIFKVNMMTIADGMSKVWPWFEVSRHGILESRQLFFNKIQKSIYSLLNRVSVVALDAIFMGAIPVLAPGLGR